METCGPCRVFADQFVLLTGVIEGHDISGVLAKPSSAGEDDALSQTA